MSLDSPPHPIYNTNIEEFDIYIHKMGILIQSNKKANLIKKKKTKVFYFGIESNSTQVPKRKWKQSGTELFR